MGVGPQMLDESLEGERLLREFGGEHGPFQNQWIRSKRSGRPDRFFRANEVSGENVALLPEGAEEVCTIDPAGANRIRIEFAAFVARYESSEFGPVSSQLAESWLSSQSKRFECRKSYSR